jgi:hypothetical protein
VQIVISGAFNNKSVHFVGVISVWLSTCMEGQQLKQGDVFINREGYNYVKVTTLCVVKEDIVNEVC